MALGQAEHLEVEHRSSVIAVGRSDEGFEEGDKVTGEARDRWGIEEIEAVFETPRKAMTALAERQAEIELCRAARDRLRPEREAGQLGRSRRRVLQGEPDLEEGHVSQAAFGRQFLDQALER